MATIELPGDFNEFLRLLNGKQIEYLLVGGVSVIYHGFVCNTGDLDIWVAACPDTAERMVEVLREFGFDVPGLTPELFLRENAVIRMGLEPVRIEVVTGIAGVEFSTCYGNRVRDEINGIPVNVISLPDLKRNKAAAGRPQDLADLDHLP